MSVEIRCYLSSSLRIMDGTLLPSVHDLAFFIRLSDDRDSLFFLRTRKNIAHSSLVFFSFILTFDVAIYNHHRKSSRSGKQTQPSIRVT